jgi:glycosyltransferase involved in cell wall biosynthesis
LAWRTVVPLGERVYDLLLTRYEDWPISPLPEPAANSGVARHVAYYIWRFPVLSETFIRRELGALEEAGVDVTILADAPGAGAPSDPELRPFVRRTRYVLPVAPRRILLDLITSVATRPLRTANMFAYTLLRPYNVPKSFSQDVRVFVKAVRVASMLRALNITHLHVPWGDTNAFIGMVAARLARASFSVQFRAQDLHRRTLAFLVAEKVHNARFVITNTQFNLEHLRSLSRAGDHSRIHQIYNGLALERLEPSRLPRTPEAGVARILSVARLIEPKGLPYLFEACRVLVDRGRDLRCTVVGGPELPLYVNDLIAIRRARQRLDLEDIVELTGAQPFERVIEAYRSSDIFVLPCVVGADASNDIIPNAILEAMAMGVPVVATRITAIPELVEDGVSGLLVAPNDTAALTEAIDRLVCDPELRARLAANARARVLERFDVNKNVRAYAALFAAS